MNTTEFIEQRNSRASAHKATAARALHWDDDDETRAGMHPIDDRRLGLRIARAMPDQEVCDYPARLDWTALDQQ